MIVMPPVFNAGDTIYFFFDTYDSNGASVTMTGLAVTDIEVYKNGSVTQRSSDSGFALLDTDGIDFDGTTGLHGFSIDTSDNTDAGFWVDGAQYLVNVNAVTVNSQTVRFSYLLMLGYLLRPTTAGRKIDVSSGGEAGVDWANVGSPTTTLALTGTTIATTQKVDVETIKTNPVVNGGTITFPTTATLASTTNITAGTVTTATNVTTVNGLAAGVITVTSIADGAIDAATFAAGAIDAAALASDAVTEIQSGLATAANLATVAGYLDTEIAAILADTNELQTDWVNGGRLDNILDARSSQTSVDDLPTNAELATALGTADDATLAAIAALNNLSQANIRTAVGLGSANLDTQLADIPTVSEFNARTLAAADYFDPAADTVANVTTVGSVTTKTGYSLASTGLDSISITAPSGVASNFREMVVQLWRRFFKRTTKDSDEIKTYADNGTSVLTTQVYTSVGDDDDVGAAT